MPPFALEWLNLAFRWIHVIAGIMWIGDSFLFMWMDRNLRPPTRPRDGAVVGELWMVHSGGFYEVVKRRYLAPNEVPSHLHWFMWEAYTTWISGFFLLGIVYYFGGAVFLIDHGVARLSPAAAIALSLGVLAAGWLVYELIWSSPLAKRPALAASLSCLLIVGATWGLTQVFSGRAAFIHVGALLGTLMAANVARHIVPAQSRMLAATRAGEPVDVTLGENAKRRSTHNHYLTLPVLFTMLSSHFPSTYGHPLAWLVLTLLMIVGAAVKVVMNDRGRTDRRVLALGLAALVAVVALTARGSGAGIAGPDLSGAPPVAFAEARAIIEARCVSCHAVKPAHPSFPEPPGGVALDDPERIRSFAPRIMERAVTTRTMPLGNLTGMTDEERLTLGAWIAQGAKVEPAADIAR
jgi:uncharacterized membrane protein